MVPIVSKLVSYADNTDNGIAIIAEDQKISYKTLTEKIFSAASKLLDMGVSRGERIILSASNTSSFIYGYFATHLIGAIAVPIAPQTPEKSIEYFIKKVSPKALFFDDNKKINSKLLHPIEELDCKKINNKINDFSSLHGIADMIFTTGTTGKPKGVVLTHRNIAAAAFNINTFMKNTSEDREVVTLPLSHSFGLGRLRCILLKGGTIILNGGFTFPGEIFQALEKWGATGLSIVPAGLAILIRLAGLKIGEYSEQLRYIEIGSAPMPLEHKNLLSDLLPKTRICMHYGLTESSRSSFIEFHESRHKPNSIGKPSPNVELKIVDEDCNELPANRKGRILVRGGMVLKEYWQNKVLTQESFKNGWFYTGDIGHTDEEGYFYLDGREKEIINVGGLKVFPIEVECIINQYDGIEDCACVGTPDPMGVTGEAVKVFLVPENGVMQLHSSSDIRNFLRLIA
jgi:long-chain acyl-CoA synthetase